jgi:hypothetical protein
VFRGGPGHAGGSGAGAAGAPLPASGDATIDGRTYVVRSFHETGFDGEPLSVWVLSGC